MRQCSSEKKKNSLLRSLLNLPGMKRSVRRPSRPGCRSDKETGITRPLRLLKKSFALNISCRLYQYAVP